MSDIALALQTGEGVTVDLDVLSYGLKLETGFRTSVLISLFTDQRVEAGELPFGQEDLRGWWGDMVSDVEADQIGSRLWLLERNKQTQATLNDFIQYARESLEWMLFDGVASEISVVGSYPAREVISLEITISKPSGSAERFKALWDFEKDQVNVNAI